MIIILKFIEAHKKTEVEPYVGFLEFGREYRYRVDEQRFR